MSFETDRFSDPTLDPEYVAYLVDRQAESDAGRLERLWSYFLNPMSPAAEIAGVVNADSRPYVQAQEFGLPPRITGVQRAGRAPRELTDLRRKEVVIENDIAWRVHAMVDFLFGRGVTVRSLAADAGLARAVERVVAGLLDANGGVRFCQEIALLGAVYGFVDVSLRTPAGGPALQDPSRPPSPGQTDDAPEHPSGGDGASRRPDISLPAAAVDRAVEAAGRVRFEPVEAPRIVPILHEDDYRVVRYWMQRYLKHPTRLAEQRRSWLPFNRTRRGPAPAVVEVVEIVGPAWWQRYEDRELAVEGPNPLGRVPVVHIQNLPLPGRYAGLGDVEPLMPLQDELNTRLSDRANRVTFQSFKMYLGKGIDDFLERPVSPGQMWATHNLDARIEEFGSDTGSPSEDAHVEQVRQAMDKVSGVTPLAAGLIRGTVGNLTSATALKVVLGGLLAKTARKRLTYGAGLRRLIELSLDWLDRTGALRTRPADRKVEINWPSPLPADDGEQLRNALTKRELGVPDEQVLAELGYGRNAAVIE